MNPIKAQSRPRILPKLSRTDSVKFVANLQGQFIPFVYQLFLQVIFFRMWRCVSYGVSKVDKFQRGEDSQLHSILTTT